MNLFEIKNNIVTFSPQALMLSPFKEIWDNDRSKDKTNANKELSYVYYMADDRSDYMYILDEEERSEVISKILDIEEGWIIPSYIEKAIVYYKKISETVYTKMLESSRNIVNKVRMFNDNAVLDEKDKMGKFVHNTKNILASVKDVLNALESLDKIENLIIKQKELKAQSGNRTVGTFDDEGI